MTKALFSFLTILFLMEGLHSQTVPDVAKKDSTTLPPKVIMNDAIADSIKEASLQALMVYPWIKSNKASGVLPVPNIDEKQDINLEYKLVFGLAQIEKDKMQKANSVLSEIARSLNLHAAAGIPNSHIHVVVIIFRQGLNILLKEDLYKAKFHSSNPNIALIEELQKAGVKFMSCGQSMMTFGIPKEMMIPGIRVAISARTSFTQYETLGYVPG